MRLSLGDQQPSTSKESLAILRRYSHGKRNDPAIAPGSQAEFPTHFQNISPSLLDIPLPADFVETHATFDQDVTALANGSVTVQYCIKDYLI